VLFYLRNDINDGEVGVKVAEGHGAKLRDARLNLLMARVQCWVGYVFCSFALI